MGVGVGLAGKGYGGNSRPRRPLIPPRLPVTSAPGPCAVPFCSAAPHPQSPGVRPPGTHEVPGRRLQCSSGSGDSGGGERREEGKEGGRWPLVPLLPLPEVRPQGPSCWLGPSEWPLLSPSHEEGLQGCGAQCGVLGVVGGE